MFALCFGIPAVSLIFSPFILGYIIAGVPGDHGINGDGWDARAFFSIVYITPIGGCYICYSGSYDVSGCQG